MKSQKNTHSVKTQMKIPYKSYNKPAVSCTAVLAQIPNNAFSKLPVQMDLGRKAETNQISGILASTHGPVLRDASSTNRLENNDTNYGGPERKKYTLISHEAAS